MPTLTNLDLDTLRTFPVANDLGGLAQACICSIPRLITDVSQERDAAVSIQ